MTPELPSLLDNCLARVKDGEPLERVVADYPEQAAELLSLARIALTFEPLRQTVPPDPVAVAVRRQEFLALAERLRQAELQRASRPVPRRRLVDRLQSFTWPRPVGLRWAAALALVVILFVGIGRGVVVAADEALPGDVLYPVKRAVENVQLSLTFDQATLEKLRMRQAARRQAEVSAIVNARREVAVSFEGVIAAVTPTRVTVTGFPDVVIEAGTVVSGELTPGARVGVEAVVGDDGALHARRIGVIAPAPPATATPTVTALLPRVVVVTSTPVPSVTTTASPTATGMPGVALATEIPATRKPTRTPRINLNATVTNTLVPTTTPVVSPSATSGVAAVPTRLQRYRFDGRIEAIAGEVWTIGGRSMLVDDDTELDETAGNAEVGAQASVTAERQSNGALLALRIVVKQPHVIAFGGTLDEIGDGYWVVGGRKVVVNAATKIEGKPEVGATARVEAIQDASGSLVALHIVVESAQMVHFTAMIVSMTSDSWLVGNWRIYVDSTTAVEGKPAVGEIAEVTGRVRSDGTLLAVRIRVRPRPTATATATQPPAATGTPEPTATPTAPADDGEPTVEPVATGTPEEAPDGVSPDKEVIRPTEFPAMREQTPAPEAGRES